MNGNEYGYGREIIGAGYVMWLSSSDSRNGYVRACEMGKICYGGIINAELYTV